MANSLQEKMELVVWGAEQNVYSAARAHVFARVSVGGTAAKY